MFLHKRLSAFGRADCLYNNSMLKYCICPIFLTFIIQSAWHFKYVQVYECRVLCTRLITQLFSFDIFVCLQDILREGVCSNFIHLQKVFRGSAARKTRIFLVYLFFFKNPFLLFYCQLNFPVGFRIHLILSTFIIQSRGTFIH